MDGNKYDEEFQRQAVVDGLREALRICAHYVQEIAEVQRLINAALTDDEALEHMRQLAAIVAEANDEMYKSICAQEEACGTTLIQRN